MTSYSVSLAALACALASPAMAADDVGGSESAASTDTDMSQGGQEGAASSGGVIVVTGTRDAYGADSTRTATRTDTPLVDVPQAVSVVTERQNKLAKALDIDEPQPKPAAAPSTAGRPRSRRSRISRKIPICFPAPSARRTCC